MVLAEAVASGLRALELGGWAVAAAVSLVREQQHLSDGFFLGRGDDYVGMSSSETRDAQLSDCVSDAGPCCVEPPC